MQKDRWLRWGERGFTIGFAYSTEGRDVDSLTS